MKTVNARVILFGIWAILFMVYVGMFLLVARYKDVDVLDARAAAWRSAYIMLPILSAFAGFWFLPQRDQNVEPPRLVPIEHAIGIFVLTFIVHGLVLLYFLTSVVYYRFPLAPTPGEDFESSVDFGLNLLMFLSTLAVLPVGWLLGNSKLRRLTDGS